jgi:hypothetical protein
MNWFGPDATRNTEADGRCAQMGTPMIFDVHDSIRGIHSLIKPVITPSPEAGRHQSRKS